MFLSLEKLSTARTVTDAVGPPYEEFIRFAIASGRYTIQAMLWVKKPDWLLFVLGETNGDMVDFDR